MSERKATIERNTSETQIQLALAVDGNGVYEIDTPIPFFNHMLDLFAKHALLDLNIKATGDVEVDYHHLVEDVGIVLGRSRRHWATGKVLTGMASGCCRWMRRRHRRRSVWI